MKREFPYFERFAIPCGFGRTRLVALLLFAGFIGVFSNAHGQGTIIFNNHVTGVIATRVYAPEIGLPSYSKTGNTSAETPAGTQTYTGAAITGNGWTAQLWAAPGSNQPESALQAGSPTTTFRTGAAAGKVAGTTATLTGVPPDAPVATVQLRVWPSTYPNWAAAYAAHLNGLAAVGKSPTFDVTDIGGTINTAPNLLGLRSFSLVQEMGDDPIPPTIITQPTNQTAILGQNVSLTVLAASGCCSMRYQWSWEGTNIDGATNTSLLLTNVQFTQAGNYSVVVSNLYGPAISSNALLTVVYSPPQITSHPVGVTTNQGATVKFTVAAVETGDLIYQWRFNGTPILNATLAQLILTDVQLTNSGNYSVLVSNYYSFSVSSNALLTVTNSPLTGNAPVITRQPSNVLAQVGDTVSFSVVATGTPPLTYQWRLNTVKIPGATASQLTIADLQNVNFGNYQVIVSNAFGQVVSTPASLNCPGGGGTVVFNTHVFSVTSSRVYYFEAADPTLAKAGNTVFDTPVGTQTYSGAPLTGSGFYAQLWAAKDSGRVEPDLVPASPVTTFRSGAAAGFLYPATAILPAVPPEYPIATLQLRVWDNRNGTIANWSQVLADSTIPRGLSSLFELSNIGGFYNVPPNLIGLQSFNLFVPTNQGPALSADPSALSAAGFKFIASGEMGAVYEIQVCTNFGSGWSWLATVTNLYGKLVFQDPGATNDTTRIYRAMKLSP